MKPNNFRRSALKTALVKLFLSKKNVFFYIINRQTSPQVIGFDENYEIKNVRISAICVSYVSRMSKVGGTNISS